MNPDCLHSLDMEQITASFLQAFAQQLEQVQLLERQEQQQVRLRHQQQVQRERQRVLRQLELVLRQERVREQALLLFCHKR